MPKRPLRISDEVALTIWRLHIRNIPKIDIARSQNVHRRTVDRVIARTQAVMAADPDTLHERARAIAVYREVQREAWLAAGDAKAHGRSPVLGLAEVRQAQQRIDTLLGLAPVSDDPIALLAEFKSTIVSLILVEAPELAPRLAERLTARAAEAS